MGLQTLTRQGSFFADEKHWPIMTLWENQTRIEVSLLRLIIGYLVGRQLCVRKNSLLSWFQVDEIYFFDGWSTEQGSSVDCFNPIRSCRRYGNTKSLSNSISNILVRGKKIWTHTESSPWHWNANKKEEKPPAIVQVSKENVPDYDFWNDYFPLSLTCPS